MEGEQGRGNQMSLEGGFCGKDGGGGKTFDSRKLGGGDDQKYLCADFWPAAASVVAGVCGALPFVLPFSFSPVIMGFKSCPFLRFLFPFVMGFVAAAVAAAVATCLTLFIAAFLTPTSPFMLSTLLMRFFRPFFSFSFLLFNPWGTDEGG